MKVVTAAKMEEIVEASVKGTQPVSILSETNVRMVVKHRVTKEPNPYLGAVKTQKKNGLIGFDYENSVNNQASREDKEQREAKPRQWGVLSASRLFVHHKDASYIQLKLQSSTDTVYELDGEVIAFEDIQPYLSSNKPSSTQEDLEKQVIVNDIKMENIKAITMKGETYFLDHRNSHEATKQEKERVAQPAMA